MWIARKFKIKSHTENNTLYLYNYTPQPSHQKWNDKEGLLFELMHESAHGDYPIRQTDDNERFYKEYYAKSNEGKPIGCYFVQSSEANKTFYAQKIGKNYYISSSLIDVRDGRNSKIHKEMPNTKFRVHPCELPWLTENDGIVPIRLELKERIILPMKWNSMDTEPLMCGVILYSKRENKIFDGSYIGYGRFQVNNLTVNKSNFDCWIQRETFFKGSGLKKFLDDAKI